MTEYIEREAVLAKMVTGWIVSGIEDDVVTVDDIESIPAEDVAPVVHGRWIKGENWSVTCSVCGCLAIAHDGKNYCTNCGAKMDAGGGE